MITIKNIQTGETKNVYNTEYINGYVKSNTGKSLGKRFTNGWAGILTETTDEAGRQVFTLSTDWEVVTGKGERKHRQPKAKKDEQTETVVTENENPTANTESEHVENDAKVENGTTTSESENEDTSNEQALIAALKNLRGGAVDANKVREIVASELAKLLQDEPAKVAKIRETVRKASKKDDEVFCAKFDRILAKVSRGNNVYLYGRAGSGKSHTAEQIAEKLGLDFYGQTTIQFAHDVRGYGDAGGNFQETPFFKAFSHGGLYFQDEYDRSNAEAAIVLNSALANGWYDFPIVGRVEAHPNFRFMAAGNTLMTGPDEEYVTGQEIDASSRDRFAYFFKVDYDHRVEIRIANGHDEIVEFAEDVRKAIIATGIKHVVSYRATKAMLDETENEKDFVSCIEESVFKGLEIDAIREIYGALENKNNVWARATKQYINEWEA